MNLPTLKIPSCTPDHLPWPHAKISYHWARRNCLGLCISFAPLQFPAGQWAVHQPLWSDVAQEIANIFSCVRFCICKLEGSKGSLIDTNPHLDFCSPPPLFPLSLPTFPPQSHRSFTIFLIKIYIFNPLAIS